MGRGRRWCGWIKIVPAGPWWCTVEEPYRQGGSTSIVFATSRFKGHWELVFSLSLHVLACIFVVYTCMHFPASLEIIGAISKETWHSYEVFTRRPAFGVCLSESEFVCLKLCLSCADSAFSFVLYLLARSSVPATILFVPRPRHLGLHCRERVVTKPRQGKPRRSSAR